MTERTDCTSRSNAIISCVISPGAQELWMVEYGEWLVVCQVSCISQLGDSCFSREVCRFAHKKKDEL